MGAVTASDAMIVRAESQNLGRQMAREGAAAIASLSLAIGLTAAGACVADIWCSTVLEGWRDWGVALGVASVGVLTFQLARVWGIWEAHLARSSRAAQSANFSELFFYLVLIHSLLAGIVFLSTLPAAFGANSVNLSHTDRAFPDLLQVWIVVALFGISFVPLLVAFLLQSLRAVRSKGLPLLRDDAISTASLLLMTGLFGGIALLAWAAAGRMFEITSDFGVMVTGVVIVAFVATILAPHIARFWNDRSEIREERGAYVTAAYLLPPLHPAKVVSHLDSILVRLVAPLSGATQRHLPHFVLIAMMMPLCALGFILASPFGLIPIAIGMLIVLALGRRWAWLEDDRETASRLQSTEGKEIHVGFENDLKDEALLGYAWLFILVPLALNQLQEWTHSFRPIEGAASGNAFVDWLRFFGAELAKAVPFVDWWEIYNVNVQTPFDARDAEPLAKHLTFVARALVDLVIMAALFQALGIWQRSRAQQRLYDAGQLDYFDPFTEIAFFETGMHSGGKSGPKPKKNFSDRVDRHVAARQALGRAPLPYNSHRLAELTKSPRADVSAGAAWLIENYGVLTGAPQQQLHQLRNRWIKFRIHILARENSQASLALIRTEKLEFERILSGLGEASDDISDAEVGALVLLLGVVKGAPDFGYSRELAYQLLGKVASDMAVLVLAHCILELRHRSAKPDWKERLSLFSMEVPSLFEDRADIRERVYEALKAIGLNGSAGLRARRLALELLQWMAIPRTQNDGLTGDRASSAGEAARDAAEDVARSLGLESE